MTFLSMQVRSDAPSVEQQHVRRKEVDYTREGFPDTAQGRCSCGWAGARHLAELAPIGHDPVDRDLHAQHRRHAGGSEVTSHGTTACYYAGCRRDRA